MGKKTIMPRQTKLAPISVRLYASFSDRGIFCGGELMEFQAGGEGYRPGTIAEGGVR